MLLSIVLFLFCAVVLYDCLTLLKTADKREKIIYFTITAVSFIMLMPYSLGITAPPLINFFKYIIDAMFHLNQ